MSKTHDWSRFPLHSAGPCWQKNDCPLFSLFMIQNKKCDNKENNIQNEKNDPNHWKFYTLFTVEKVFSVISTHKKTVRTHEFSANDLCHSNDFIDQKLTSALPNGTKRTSIKSFRESYAGAN